MKCASCQYTEVQPPCFSYTVEQLDAFSVEMMTGHDNATYAGRGSWAIGEVARFRRGLCWGCDYDARRAKEREQIAEAQALRAAQDAFANEGGRCSP
jgi:hypothetical protein